MCSTNIFIDIASQYQMNEQQMVPLRTITTDLICDRWLAAQKYVEELGKSPFYKTRFLCSRCFDQEPAFCCAEKVGNYYIAMWYVFSVNLLVFPMRYHQGPQRGFVIRVALDAPDGIDGLKALVLEQFPTYTSTDVKNWPPVQSDGCFYKDDCIQMLGLDNQEFLANPEPTVTACST